MKEEIIEKILRKMKETVSENNYKLALAITGHRPGKIRDVLMSSKDGETLLEYIENLQSQLKAKEEAENTFKEWIATEQFRLARSVSHTYKDSLNKTHLVNEDIFDELAIVLDKYNEILSKGENK